MFDNQNIIFDEFKDRKLKKFIECNGGTIRQEFNANVISLIVYADKSNFRDSNTYNIAKENNIKYLSKSKFLDKFDLVLDNDNNIYICNMELLEDDGDDDIDIIDTEEDIYSDIKNKINTELGDISNGKKMCQLIKNNLDNFYDEIYIPYNLFSENDWNVINVLYDNSDSLFYSEEYLTESDKEFFFKIFDKYVRFIGKIWVPNSQLNIYLKKWDKMEKPTYLKQIMTNEKYQIISPVYLADLYKKIFIKYKDDTKIFNIKFNKKLDKIITEYENCRDEFDVEFNKIVNSYVYEYPISFSSNATHVNSDSDHIANYTPCGLEPTSMEVDYTYRARTGYTKEFINAVTLSVISFADKLIDLNIYAIHSIIYDIINYYVPLDDINSYDPDDYKDRNILLII